MMIRQKQWEVVRCSEPDGGGRVREGTGYRYRRQVRAQRVAQRLATGTPAHVGWYEVRPLPNLEEQ